MSKLLQKYRATEIVIRDMSDGDISDFLGWWDNRVSKSTQSKSGLKDQPYIYITETNQRKLYNSQYGDERKCQCGHSYHRHFDTYENMEAVGCKYCECNNFREA